VTHQQAGFTVLELLIASSLAVGVILMAVTGLGTARQSEQIELAYQRLNENARLATDVLRQAVQRAGHPGCHPSVRRNLIADGHDPAWPAVEVSAEGAVTVTGFRAVLEANIPAESAEEAILPLGRSHGIATGTPVVVRAASGDACALFIHTGEGQRALSRAPGGGASNRLPATGYRALTGAVTVFALERVIFEVGPSSMHAERRSLFRRRASARYRREELVVGVEALSARMLSHDQTVTAAPVGVSLALEVASGRVEKLGSAPLRLPVDLTVALRNRWP